MFFSTSLPSKNTIFHDFITMMEQNNMDLEFQFLLMVQPAGKDQATNGTGIKLSSYCEPGFQVPSINIFSVVIYRVKDTHVTFTGVQAPICDVAFPGQDAIPAFLSYSKKPMEIKNKNKNMG